MIIRPYGGRMIIRPYGSEKFDKLGFETFYESVKQEIPYKINFDDF